MAGNDDNSEPTSQGRMPLPIRYRLALSFALLIIIAATAFWLLFQNELDRSLDSYSNILGESLAEQTAATVRELVLVNDQLGLNVVLTQLVRDDNISHASVFDVDGNLLASAGLELTGEGSETTNYSADIAVQEAIAGAVQLQLNAGESTAYKARLRNVFMLILAVTLVLVVAAAFALAGQITSPINALTQSIDSRIEVDDHQEDVPVEETARLQQSVDNLMVRLLDMEEQLLETGVWQGSSDDTGELPARLASSLLVIKVVNINTGIELLHPSTLANLLREYVFYLNQAARLYGGEFHRLNGESVLVSFDEDNCDERHGINALYCAGLFLMLMDQINARHRAKGKQTLDFRLAIHSGDIFHAPGLGGNNREHGADGILGKAVDIAYFLCNQATPWEPVISESACSQARESEAIETAGQHEFTMPADNMTFMAYSLSRDFASNMGLLGKQSDHILRTLTED